MDFFPPGFVALPNKFIQNVAGGIQTLRGRLIACISQLNIELRVVKMPFKDQRDQKKSRKTWKTATVSNSNFEDSNYDMNTSAQALNTTVHGTTPS